MGILDDYNDIYSSAISGCSQDVSDSCSSAISGCSQDVSGSYSSAISSCFQDISSFCHTIDHFRESSFDLEKTGFYISHDDKEGIYQLNYGSGSYLDWYYKNIFDLEDIRYFFERYIDYIIHGSVGHIPKSKPLSNSTSSFFRSGCMRMAAIILIDKNEAFLFHSKIDNNSSGHKRGVMGGRCINVLAHEVCDPGRHQMIMA